MSTQFDNSGSWHSSYIYQTTTKPGTFKSEHDVKIYNVGNQLVIQSTPMEDGSYLLIRGGFDGRVLTGTWHEETSPTGPYKGVSYYGALQLVLDKDGNAMHGKYVGFNRKMGVQAGDWEIIRKTSNS